MRKGGGYPCRPKYRIDVKRGACYFRSCVGSGIRHVYQKMKVKEGVGLFSTQKEGQFFLRFYKAMLSMESGSTGGMNALRAGTHAVKPCTSA